MKPSRLAIVVVSVLFVLIAVARVTGPAAQPQRAPSGAPAERAAGPPAAAPSDWQSAAIQQIAAEEYEVTWKASAHVEGLEAAWQAPNRAHNLRTYFVPSGIRVVPRTEERPSWQWGLEWVGYGRGGRSWGVEPATPEAKAARVAYRRDGSEEWYVNTPRGLEQGFRLTAPPDEIGRRAGREAETLGMVAHGRVRGAAVEALIHLDLALTGTLRPAIAEDGQAIDFEVPGGARVIHYAELMVNDARGAELAAWMEGFAAPRAHGIRIVIDATDAVYPITIDPLATSPAWTAESDQAGAGFGASVATAGDVNGDGHSDVIVGAHTFDNGQADEGKAFVYLGSAAGLAATAAWSAEGDQASANFAISVATAGDVNGDAYSDVIVGAYNFDNGQTNEGRAYVYLGSASGLAATAAWTAESDASSARFGRSVATAGDVNGDGYSDVIVGANAYNNGTASVGRAYVYHGSSTGLAGTPAWTTQGEQANGAFGFAVATAGDVNVDGYADVIVGQWAYTNGQDGEGRAYVYLGSASGLSTSAVWTAEGDVAGSNFGYSVATAGDVDGDGYSEIIVGAPYYGGTEVAEGRAYVYFGGPGGPASVAEWVVEGNQAAAGFGYSVATAGDVNGDGYADVIVGAYRYSNGESQEGRAFLYLGSAPGLSLTPEWTFESDQANANFGSSVATAGDINGDGRSDVIVGAPLLTNGQSVEGRAYAFHGSPSGLATTAGWSAEGDVAYAAFGMSVGAAGDVDGDGHSDVLVGAPWYDGGQTVEGRVYLYRGFDHGLWATPAWIAEGWWCGGFGSSVAGGDINGDGYSDVIVGAPGGTCAGVVVEGRALAYLGSAAGLQTTAVWNVASDQPTDFGVSVAGGGDLNGDGYADVVVGAPNYSNEEASEGRAYVYYGSSSGLPVTAGWVAESHLHWGGLGQSVGFAGDVDGDGYSDLIVGVSGGGLGRAFLYRGSPVGLPVDPTWTLSSGQVGDNFAASVAPAGDVNGDGYADVIVGVTNHSSPEAYEGRAVVYLGSAAGLQTSPAWSAEPNESDTYFGTSVGTAGDVNGDGYADVIVGGKGDYYSRVGRASVYLGSASGLAGSPAWTALGGQSDAAFGSSVGTAGDVDGNGYSDVIVGAPFYSSELTVEGQALVFYGGGGSGRYPPRLAMRRADDAAPIAPLGFSDDPSSFRFQMFDRTPFGRGRVRLQWEARPLGTPFDGTDLQTDAGWSDTGAHGQRLTGLVTGFAAGDRVRWRARLLYDPSTLPFLPHGRWLTGSWNGPEETDLRTRLVADFAVTQIDREDPVLRGEDLTYDLDIQNLGPDPAGALVVHTIPAGSTLVSALGGGATCDQASGEVRCQIDSTPPGAHRSVSVTVTLGATGTAISTVQVGSYGRDDAGGNNRSEETTTVLDPGIGDRVWQDYDADGVQDEVEAGQPGTIVALYRGDTTFLASTITDANGAYSFADLTYGEFYYLRFFPPEPLVFSPRDASLDDTLDSDADPATGRTVTFQLYRGVDVTRWDAGMKWDRDGDGHTVWYNDCDDSDPTVYPGALQVCDGKNNDCSDPSWPAVPLEEQDRDGDGYRPCSGDCNNGDPYAYPGRYEICNGLDDDCDSVRDEDCDAGCDVPAEISTETDLTPGAAADGVPKLVWTGSDYAAVWSDTRDGNAEIYFARYTANLDPIGSAVRVTNDAAASQSPALTWTGMAFGVAWSDTRDAGDQEIYVALLDSMGNKTGGDVRVTSATGMSRFPRIAWSGLDYGLLWTDHRDGSAQIYTARMDATGVVVPGSEWRLTTPPANTSGAQWTWNGWAYGVVYNVFRDADWEIYFQAMDRYGMMVTPETRLTTSVGTSRSPSIAWDSVWGQFGISWMDNRSGAEELFFMRVLADGTKLTGDSRLVAIETPAAPNNSLTHSGDEFALAWQDTRAGNTDIYFARLAGDVFNGPEVRVTDDPGSSTAPALAWNGYEYLVGFMDTRPGPSHVHAARIGCCTVSTLGDRAWNDSDRNGIQDAGEAGVSNVLVAVYDASGVLLDFVPTAVGGGYLLSGLSCGSTYSLRFFPPPGMHFSPPDQGGDDTLDSDADTGTGATAPFVLTSSADGMAWDVGLHDCWVPDEPVFIANVRLSIDGNNYPILDYQDPNQPEQATGYNVRRSSVAGLPMEEWPLVATDVVDMDEATPNRQWVDESGDVSPTGAWYYQVTAYSNRCAAEGPF